MVRKPGRFSFNVAGGRCEACQGEELAADRDEFPAHVYVPCEVCRASRYNDETLAVKYKGVSIADLLECRGGSVGRFLENIPAVQHKLETLVDVGLGYIHLG